MEEREWKRGVERGGAGARKKFGSVERLKPCPHGKGVRERIGDGRS